MLNSIKHSIFTASIAAFAVVSPTYASTINIDLSVWESIGEVATTSDGGTFNSGTLNTVVTGGSVGSLEDFLGVPGGSLDPVNSVFGATQGSAIRRTFAGIQAGDLFSFDWSLLTTDSDSAFVTINNSVLPLVGGSPFNYVFNATGDYQVGIGIVDVEDSLGESQLIVNNPILVINDVVPTPTVPEPSMTLGYLAVLGLGIGMRQFRQNSIQK